MPVATASLPCLTTEPKTKIQTRSPQLAWFHFLFPREPQCGPPLRSDPHLVRLTWDTLGLIYPSWNVRRSERRNHRTKTRTWAGWCLGAAAPRRLHPLSDLLSTTTKKTENIYSDKHKIAKENKQKEINEVRKIEINIPQNNPNTTFWGCFKTLLGCTTNSH